MYQRTKLNCSFEYLNNINLFLCILITYLASLIEISTHCINQQLSNINP